MSFGGSLWSLLNFTKSSKVDELLSNPDTSLEQLLDDDNIISEFKGLNPRLIEFQTDDKVKQLLSYLIEEPPEDADRNRGYKYPFVSCEILTADIQPLLSAFFGKNPNKKKDMQRNTQELSSDTDDDSNNRDENIEDQNHEKVEEDSKQEKLEPEQKEQEIKESKEEENITKEDNENREADQEEGKETDSSKEGREETRQERFSITIRGPPKDEEIQKPQETEDNEKELAHYFFSFLDQERLNVTLVGYFSRFLNHVNQKRGVETAEFIWENPKIVDNFIKHVEYASLAECLAKIFCLEGLPHNMTNNFLDIRLSKLRELVQVFNEDVVSLNNDAITNTASIVCEIINKKAIALKGAELQAYFFSEEFIELIFKNLFRHNTLTTHLSLILNTLLQVLLQVKNKSHTQPTLNTSEPLESPDSPTKENDTINFDENILYDHLASGMGDLVEYLEKESREKISTTYGNTHKPFGIAKLRIVEAILYMVKLDVHKLSFELGLKKIFQVLMGLMRAFEWNNMLHNLIEKIFVSTLESNSHVLKQKLLSQANLVNFLNEATIDIIYQMPNAQQRKMRRGYLGQITNIGKVLEKLAENNKDIKEYLNNDNWAEFFNSYLKPSIKAENQDLAGFSKKNNDLFGEDNIHIGNNIEEALGGKFDSFFGFDTKPPEENNADTFKDFDSFGKGFETWDEQNDGRNQEGMTSSWPVSFETQNFKFEETSPLTIEHEQLENKYLGLNKEVKVVDIVNQEEVKLEEEFVENRYWAKPRNVGNIDDILKEFEKI